MNQIQIIASPEEIQSYFDRSMERALKNMGFNPVINQETKESEQKQFTIAELAAYLKCTKATIHAYKNREIFPYYQTGRTIFFKKDEVDAALSVGKNKRSELKEKN